jgi:hypothetical protein
MAFVSPPCRLLLSAKCILVLSGDAHEMHRLLHCPLGSRIGSLHEGSWADIVLLTNGPSACEDYDAQAPIAPANVNQAQPQENSIRESLPPLTPLQTYLSGQLAWSRTWS